MNGLYVKFHTIESRLKILSLIDTAVSKTIRGCCFLIVNDLFRVCKHQNVKYGMEA